MTRTALTVLILLTLLSLHTYAQQLSFSGNGVHLETVFSSITKQTGYVFFYNAELLKNASSVSIQLKNVSPDSALRSVLKDQPFSFDIQGRTIFITSFSESANEPKKKSPEYFKIRGRVTNQSGFPLEKASVGLSGGNITVTTNANGDFEIHGRKTDSLTISSIGYRKKTVFVNGSFLNISLQQVTSPMEQVIVGGNLFATKRKSDITSVTMIDSKTLQYLPVTDIAQIYRGFVPGTNNYSAGDGPQEFPALSIRGAGSETSLSLISVYVDGIEWAGGSGYLASINKENIDRVEILRGPESSTLYGTGSNGGVVQIYTKQASPQTSDLTVRASAGFIQTIWTPSPVFQQYYTINKTIGFKNAGITVGGTYQSNGAWLPGGGEKGGTAYLAFKWDLSKKIAVDISGYYAGANQGVSRIPVYDTIASLSDSIRNYYGLIPRKLSNKEAFVHSYFGGLNLSYRVSGHWIHRLTVGFSQNDNHESALAQVDPEGRVPDNFYQSVNITTTLRYSNLLNLGNKEKDWSLGLTSGADYKNFYYASRIEGSRPFIRSNDPANTNIGLFMQANPSYKNIYLTAALRYDYNRLFKDNHSWNPRLGLTTNFDLSKLIVKPRISWGSGITAPSYQARFGSPSDGFYMFDANPNIKPQQQSGFDYGLEFFDHSGKFSSEVVYYDNVLKDIFVDTDLPPTPDGIYVFQTTNLGSISNKGWEFSARYHLNQRFSAYATFSIMHSVLKDTSGSYLSSQFAGRTPGYALKFLPKHTAGLFLNYTFFKIFRKKDHATISLNLTEVDGIIQPDSYQWTLDIAHQLVPDGSDMPERYWISSTAFFRMGLYVEYALSTHFQFIAQGNNILNQNSVEISPYRAGHGATWLFGFKYSIQKTNSPGKSNGHNEKY